VLDVIERDGLLAAVATVGGALKLALLERKPRWDAIGDVRGHGLFIGVEMIKDPEAKTPDATLAAEMCNRLKDRGFLTAPAGAFGNVVKIRPPLVFSQDDAGAFLDAFDATLAELHG
jgi:4-aminobutyrate aminotransferase-like enzyme